MRTANEANKEKFFKAAVSELEEHGVSDFSIRRVAKRCGVSCAAPYKHFESKNDLLLQVMRYIGKKWEAVWKDTMNSHKDEPYKEQIIAICMAYIVFLCTYPEYQTILYMNDRVFPPEILAEKSKLTSRSEGLINDYCTSVNMPDDVKKRKKFIILSILYGGSIMINSGAIPFDGDTMDMIKANIRREFDID